MRRVTSLDRVAGCGQAAVDVHVPVRMSNGVASYGQIITCESVWACAVCSASVRQRRADVVDYRARRWLENEHGLLFGTLTVPHSMDDDLAVLMQGMSLAWRRVQQHSRWRHYAEVWGIVGQLRATEITHGYNGWHPHYHLLFWTEKPLSPSRRRWFGRALAVMWADACEAVGLKRPSLEHGVDVQSVATGVGALAKYLVKAQDGYDTPWTASAEMLRGDLKKGRARHSTPFQIAERAVAGDQGAVALWRVYESVTKGKRCQEWSRQLVRRLAADGLDDEPPEDKGEVVMELSNHEWNMLRYVGAALTLLTALERGGPEAGHAVLRTAYRGYRWRLERRARGAPGRAASGVA